MNSKVTKIESLETGFQTYDPKDSNLINSIELQRKFGLPEDYIELHIYDLNNNLLTSNYAYSAYKNLTQPPSPTNLVVDLDIDPSEDVKNEGYDQGSVKVVYNVLRNIFGSSFKNKYFIKNISSDRTELRIANNSITNQQMVELYNDFLIKFSNEAYYKDFYLNFGQDRLLIAVNVLLEETVGQTNLLIKLYEPLPVDLSTKDQFWLIDLLSEPDIFQVEWVLTNQNLNDNNNLLRGPNFNIQVNDNINSSTDYLNYNQLFSTTSTSSLQQLRSLLDEKSIELNVDYEDYENFVHFSSAKERLLNFVYKLKLIEGYKSDLAVLETSTSTPQVSSSKSIINNNVSSIIEKFDSYEYFLYYESGSKSWPKTGSNWNINLGTNTSIAKVWLGDDNDNSPWYGGQLYTSSNYDRNNQDNLYYTIPEYLKIDVQNEAYSTFIYMVGQHFDNIWLYSKGISDIQDNNSNPNQGISKDLVAYALKSLGVKLYTNTNAKENIFNYLIGGGSDSGSLLPSTGSEWITSYVTASNNTLPGSDIDKEVYKRLYHNLPFLLKSKGTERGLKALIACYGIPDTILQVNEFGGTDKDSGSIEQYFPRFSYALNTSGSTFIKTPWATMVASSSFVPNAVEFRFKTYGIPSSSFYSQSLFQVETGSSTQFGVQLRYKSQSYGELSLAISGSGGYRFTSPITLPFFDNDWWNILVYRETGSHVTSNSASNSYYLFATDSIYNGDDGENIGFIGSSSLTFASTSGSYNQAWNTFSTSSFKAYLGGATNNNVLGTSSFGSFQELRYWASALSYNNFVAHTLNPTSIEGVNVTSSLKDLIFRLALGNDLIQSGVTASSVHPNYRTGSFNFGGATQSYGFINGPITYSNQEQEYFYNSGNFGTRKPVSDKIRIITQDITSGSTLSRFTKIEQKPEIAFVKDNNIIEVVISPQDQINKDIINQLGYFDIDEYIGDPREKGQVEYTSLKALREFYFSKYVKSYNVFDIIRILKYYNNSLFKMIKDFTPARSNLSTGIAIKPHLLERSKVVTFEPSHSIYNNFTESIDVVEVNSDEGGVLSVDYNYEWVQLKPSLSGSVTVTNDAKWERFTGELSGSVIDVINGELQDNIYLVKNATNLPSFAKSDYHILLNNVSQSVTSKNYFNVDYGNSLNIPTNLNLITSSSPIAYGEIQDSNYSAFRNISSKYLGSKLTSQFYNSYVDGDVSYGKTAAIDLNTKKLGLFVGVSSSIFLPRRQEVRLKYLVDEEGGFVELNKQNNNWFEIQNTFKAGEHLVVSLFDNRKYGNQKNTEGSKSIFTSGYDFQPTLYFSSSDEKLYFDFQGDSVPSLFRFTNLNSTISGSAPDTYPIGVGGGIYNWFDQPDGTYSAEGNLYYTLGSNSAATFPKFTGQSFGVHKFLIDFHIALAFVSSGQKGAFNCQIVKNGAVIASGIENFTSSVIVGYSESVRNLNQVVYADVTGDVQLKSFVTPGEIRLYSASTYLNSISGGQTVWVWTGSTSTTGPCIPDYPNVNTGRWQMVHSGATPPASAPGVSPTEFNLPNISASVCQHIDVEYSQSTKDLNQAVYIDTSGPYLVTWTTPGEIRLYSASTYVNTIPAGTQIWIWTGSIANTSCAPYFPSTGTGRWMMVHTGSTQPVASVGTSPTHFNLPYVSASICDPFGFSNQLSIYHAWPLKLAQNEPTFNALTFVPAVTQEVLKLHHGFPLKVNRDAATYDALSFVADVNTLSAVLDFNVESSFDTLNIADEVSFELYAEGFSTSNFTAGISPGQVHNEIQTSATGIYPFATNTSAPFVSGSVNSDTLIFNKALSSFLDNLYVPSTGSNALYSKYGDVDFVFAPEVNDMLLLTAYSEAAGAVKSYEYVITGVSSIDNKLALTLNDNLPTFLDKPVYVSTDFNEILLLKRFKDETMVLLTFNKRDGKTSYGFIIPNDLSQDVLQNIDAITKEMKTKILEIDGTQ